MNKALLKGISGGASVDVGNVNANNLKAIDNSQTNLTENVINSFDNHNVIITHHTSIF
jgi:hypothetical protein